MRNTENGLWSNTYSKARPLLLYSIVESVIGLLPCFMRSSHILQPSSWYHPTNFLSAVKLNRLLHYFVVHTTCTLSVHWTIPHCLSSLSTFLWCFIMQSAYITIWNTSLRALISFFQLFRLLIYPLYRLLPIQDIKLLSVELPLWMSWTVHLNHLTCIYLESYI